VDGRRDFLLRMACLCHELRPVGFQRSDELLLQLLGAVESLEQQQQRCNAQLDELLRRHHHRPAGFPGEEEQPQKHSSNVEVSEMSLGATEAMPRASVWSYRSSWGRHTHCETELDTLDAMVGRLSHKKSADGVPDISRVYSNNFSESDFSVQRLSTFGKHTAGGRRSIFSSLAHPTVKLTHGMTKIMTGKEGGSQLFARREHMCFCDFVNSRRWEYVMIPIVLANCVTIGLEVQSRVDSNGNGEVLRRLDDAFLAVFLLELVVRIRAAGRVAAVHNPWIWFDGVLVFVGVIMQWLMGLLLYHDGDTLAGRVLKLPRLLRVLRALRLLRIFDETWKMVFGMLSSASSLISAGCLILTLVYMFACIGVDLISTNKHFLADERLRTLISDRFNSVPRAMLTLVSYVTMDSLAAFYEPFIETQPQLAFYFLPIIGVVSIAVMNLVLAILLQNAHESNERNKELWLAEKRSNLDRLRPVVRDLFRQLDTDGDGFINMQDILTGEAHFPHTLGDKITTQGIVDLFSSMDEDHSGTIDLGEWEEHMMFLALHDAPVETLQILHMLREQGKRLKELSRMSRIQLHHSSMTSQELPRKPPISTSSV